VADFRFYGLVNFASALEAKFFDKHPLSKAHKERFEAIPQIKAYQSTDKFKNTLPMPPSILEKIKALHA